MKTKISIFGIAKKYGVISFLSLAIISCAHSNSETRDVRDVNQIAETSMLANDEDALSGSAEASSTPAAANGREVLHTDTESASLAESSFSDDYVLGPEDLLEISVYQVEDLNRISRISSSGFIKLPLAGLIKAEGLTAAELEAEISQRLEQYLQEPLVSIFIKEYRSQTVTILGAVKKPQVYTITHQKFLLDILSLSGGFASGASDICFIRRGNETIIIDTRKLLVDGDMKLNEPIKSGDVIHVPTGGIIFVDGAVNSPGSFTIKGKVSLTQVIAMARGMKFEAIRSDVRIYRETGGDAKDIIDVDYDDILSRKTQDIVLQDKDIVIVAESRAKQLWNQFIQSLSGSTRLGAFSVGGGF